MMTMIASDTTDTAMLAERLRTKIETRHAKIGVVGLGYVGLPLAVAFAEAGFRVMGFDIAADRAAQLNRGESYIGDIAAERLLPVVQAGKLRATSDFSVTGAQDVLIIAVPTPLTVTRDPDLGAIKAALAAIAPHMSSGQLVILESTTYPGTTIEVVKPALEKGGKVAGHDFFLAFSPERIDPGSVKFRLENTPKIVGGLTADCTALAVALYGTVCAEVVPVSSPGAAEMTKIFENTFRVVNLALVNEMALICDRMGLNVWEVLDAAATKPFGFMKFTPGPGVGGHCIPIDPFYLTWKVREYDLSTKFIELAGEINLKMPYHVRELAVRALGRFGKSIAGSSVLLLGMAYKKDVADFRESPTLKIMQVLERDGAHVAYHDPHIPSVDEHGIQLTAVDLDENTLAAADVAIIVTDHSAYDYDWIVRHANVVIDTRNATHLVREGREKIVLL